MFKKKCSQKVARKTNKKSPQKGRFEVTPSKIPLRYKDLWDIEDEIERRISSDSKPSITEGSIQSYLPKWYNLYSDSAKLSSTSYWLDHSYVTNYLYFYSNVRGYTLVSNLTKESEYEGLIDLLYEDLDLYLHETLKNNRRGFRKATARYSCKWFLYHLTRMRSEDACSLVISTDEKYYIDKQNMLKEGSLKVSGVYIKHLLSLLEHKGMGVLFKGYCLEDGEGCSSSACSMFITFSPIFDYLNVPKKRKGYFKKQDKASVYSENKNHVVVRDKDSKKPISVDKLDDVFFNGKYGWSDEVLKEHGDLLSTVDVEMRSKLLLDILFYRLFLKDEVSGEYLYGRVHDVFIQTTPKDMRKDITFNQEATVSIDLDRLHPSLLANIEGVKLPNDFTPYPVLDGLGDAKLIKKFKKYYNNTDYNPVRNFVKVALLTMINAKSFTEAEKSLRKRLKADQYKNMTFRERDRRFVGLEGIDVSAVMNKIKEHNHHIEKYLCSNYSMKLMGLDSDIITNAIEYLTKRKIPSISIHDSITVAVSNKQEAVNALRHGYLTVMGNLDNFSCSEE